MNFVSLGSYQLATLTSATGLSSRTGSVTSSTDAAPIVVTAAGHGIKYGSITAIAAGPPVKFTSTAHGLTSGDRIVISGFSTAPDTGWPNWNGAYTAQVLDANTFNITNGPTGATFGWNYAAYSSGAQWYRPEIFRVDGHSTNIALNASWTVQPGSGGTFATGTFTALNSTGSGAGAGSGGTWRTMPVGTRGVLIQALVATVSWRDDGTDPTAEASGSEKQLYAGDEPILFNGDIWKFRAINQTASSGAVLSYEFVKWT